MKYWHLYAVVHSQLLHQNPDNNIPRGMGKNKDFQYCNPYWKTSKSMWSALYMLNRSIRELNDMPRLLYLQRSQRSWQYPQCAEEASSPFESCLPKRQANKQWSGDQIKQTILSLSHLTKTSFVADMIDPRQTSFATFGYQVGKLARWNDRGLFVPLKQNVCSLICSLLTRTFYMFFFKWLKCLQRDISLVSLCI